MTDEAPAPQPGSPPPDVKLDAETVTWAMRILLGREPRNAEELSRFQALRNVNVLRRGLSNSWEFHEFFGSVLTGTPDYQMPLFLLRPPAVQGLEWRFQPPDLENPVSQLCTASQFSEPTFLEITEALGLQPSQRRVLWEQVYITSVIATEGLVGVGRRGIGFGLDRDRLPALFSSRGVEVLATSPRPTDELSFDMEQLRTRFFYPEIIHLEDFDQLITFDFAELGEAPAALEGSFDFCWSSGIPPRLGSIAAAISFFEASLRVLRPGGIAVHTFDFNLSADERTQESPNLVILRRRDIEELAQRLHAAGHSMLPLNTHPGFTREDELVATRPGGPDQLKRRYGAVIATSAGIVLRKAG